jgi:Zn-dependent peptidase ImmA (M78 family)/transcriptional regulator with XRE-family HTH domain
VSRIERFVGRRLTEARESRGLTAVSLAQMIDVTPVMISAYENGRSAPRAETLAKIAQTLNFPIAFFARPYAIRPGEDRPVFWRSLSSATKASRTKCRHRLNWLDDITAYVRQFLDLPELNLPQLSVPDSALDLTTKEIEALAAEARVAFGLGAGPIQDVILLLENHGVVVSRFQFDADALDAFCYWSRNGQPFVVMASEKQSLAREHYNAAHELGHLLLHREISMSSLNRSEQHKMLEDQAFRFASSFLLPAEAFTSELWAPTLSAFESLKPRWRTSIGVMIGRCRELGIVTDDQAKNLWIQYTRRGYKRKEPLDDQMPEIAPRMLRRSIEMLVSEQIRSKDDIRADLLLPESEIERLCSLKPGYLSDTAAPTLLELQPRVKSQQQETNTGEVGLGSLVPFERRRG